MFPFFFYAYVSLGFQACLFCSFLLLLLLLTITIVIPFTRPCGALWITYLPTFIPVQVPLILFSFLAPRTALPDFADKPLDLIDDSELSFSYASDRFLFSLYDYLILYVPSIRDLKLSGLRLRLPRPMAASASILHSLSLSFRCS